MKTKATQASVKEWRRRVALDAAQVLSQQLGVSPRAAQGLVTALDQQMRSGGSTDEAVAKLLKTAHASAADLCEQITTERGLCLLIVA